MKIIALLAAAAIATTASAAQTERWHVEVRDVDGTITHDKLKVSDGIQVASMEMQPGQTTAEGEKIPYIDGNKTTKLLETGISVTITKDADMPTMKIEQTDLIEFVSLKSGGKTFSVPRTSSQAVETSLAATDAPQIVTSFPINSDRAVTRMIVATRL